MSKNVPFSKVVRTHYILGVYWPLVCIAEHHNIENSLREKKMYVTKLNLLLITSPNHQLSFWFGSFFCDINQADSKLHSHIWPFPLCNFLYPGSHQWILIKYFVIHHFLPALTVNGWRYSFSILRLVSDSICCVKIVHLNVQYCF